MSPRYSNVTTSTHGLDYTICITQFQIHHVQSNTRTSKSAPKFLPESQDENVCQPLCISSQGHGTRKLITKTYIKWINRTSHCHHGYPIARHTSSVLKSLKTQSDKKTSKEKLNSSQEDREGKTPYDSSILIKLTVHQDRANSRTRERERDQTHSYWYKPSAPRVNYSLLVMESTGMMKMASGDAFPPPAEYRKRAVDEIVEVQRLAAA